MTYQLAKQLKNAGFLQTGLSGQFPSNGSEPEDQVYAPDLSELIEACGKGSFTLQSLGSETWRAALNGDVVDGSTPEEAVAKLWLALNK